MVSTCMSVLTWCMRHCSNVHRDSHASTLMIYLTKLETLEVALSKEDTVRLDVMDKDLKSLGFSCTMLLTSRSSH